MAFQQAHDGETTPYQRRCDVMTSRRSWYDVVLRLCEGLDGGVWYSLFIKNLAHYSSH